MTIVKTEEDLKKQARKQRIKKLNKRIKEEPGFAQQVWDRLSKALATYPPGHDMAIDWGCECDPNQTEHDPKCPHGGTDHAYAAT